MTVHFDTALVDLIAMHRYVRTHARGVSATRLFLHLASLSAIACIAFVAIVQFALDWRQSLVLVVALFLVYQVVLRSGNDDRGVVMRWLAQGLLPGVLGPTAVTLEPDCLVVQRLVRSERIAWQGFVGIAQTSDHLILFESDVVGVVIPRRAFDSAAEFQRFADETRKLQRPAPPAQA